MNRGEIKTEVLVRSGKDTTSAWTSEAFLNDWINQAHRWAAGYKPWPFTEGRQSTTYTGAEEWNFEGVKSDSVRILQIDGKRFDKINFEDYQIFNEDQSSANDRVFSDFGNTLYINPRCGLSGTLTVWGQYQPSYILDGDENDETEMVFSPGSDEGNEAIIEKVLGNLYVRDDKQTAMQHYAMAEKQLQLLWGRISEEQFKYQTKDRGMFRDFDVLEGDYTDNLSRRNQF